MRRKTSQLNAIARAYQKAKNKKVDDIIKANGWEEEAKQSKYKRKCNFLRIVKKIYVR